MKKINRIVVLAIMLLTISYSYPQAMLIKNVENIAENILIVDKNIKEKNDFINIDVEIPQIDGLFNKEREKVINNEILYYTNMWINEGKQASQEFKPTIPYEYYSRYDVTNQGKALSFYIDYYQFSGGAHGITVRRPYNINIENGEYINLNELFEKNFDYITYINENIKKEINKNPEYYFTGKDGFKGIKENQDFYIKNGKLIIHFPYYEIAPYAAGMPEFTIDLPVNM